jgi:hypothetical protein
MDWDECSFSLVETLLATSGPQKGESSPKCRTALDRGGFARKILRSRLSYTFKTVTRISSILLLSLLLSSSAFADETSFHHIQVPNAKGKAVKATLTFSDTNKAVQIQPAKGSGISIPYDAIDKFSYEYTKKHRVNDETIATAPLGIGAIAMLTKSRSHWLQIEYREQDIPKEYILRMDKHDYLRILDAVKAHTGKEAEVLGNADKRR